MSKIPKHIYRTLRAILLTAILVVVGLYLLIYIAVSMPALQKKLVAVAEKELSGLLDTSVEIGRLEIYPFNEVRLSDVKVFEQMGSSEKRPCLAVGTVGAGVELFELFKGNLVFTYAEITSLDARVTKSSPDAPYNIAFIIDAFKPKEKKESSNLNFKIRTVVIRRLSATYDLQWIPRRASGFDPAHLALNNFRADISIPSLDTKPFAIDAKVRRIAFTLNEELEVTDLSFAGSLSDKDLSLKNFVLKLPGTSLKLDDVKVGYESLARIGDALRGESRPIALTGSVTPADLSLFLPALNEFRDPWTLDLSTDFNLENLKALNLRLHNEMLGCELKVRGEVCAITHPKELYGALDIEQLSVAPEMARATRAFLPDAGPGVKRILDELGTPSLDMSGSVSRAKGSGDWILGVAGDLMTAVGSVTMDVDGTIAGNGNLSVKGTLSSDRLSVGRLAGISTLGDAGFDTDFDLTLSGKDPEGGFNLDMPYLETTSGLIENVKLNATKTGKEIGLNLMADGEPVSASVEGAMELAGADSQLFASVNLNHISSSLLGLEDKFADSSIHGVVNLQAVGNTFDNLQGSLTATALGLRFADGRDLSLDRLVIISEIDADAFRKLTLTSDVAEGLVTGHYQPSSLPALCTSLFSGLIPILNPLAAKKTILLDAQKTGEIDARFRIHPLGDWADFLNLPVRPLADLELEAKADFSSGTADVSAAVPYLQQGKKLIRDIALKAQMPAPGKMTAEVEALYPVKSTEIKLRSDIEVYGDAASLKLDFNPDVSSSFSGTLALDARVDKLLTPQLTVNLKSSDFNIRGGKWQVEDGDVVFIDKSLKVQNIKISHDDQYLSVDGSVSSDPADQLTVRLGDLDLSFIFDALNIEYVNFGGFASGSVVASELFTKQPKARTVGLRAKNFSYGGAVLGDADLSGVFHAEDTRIQIGAHIVNPHENNRRTADVDGNIWLKRDSLSFNFDADRLNASFLGQFMGAFASDVTATASGDCQLFGTFKDIDLTGRLHADSIRFKLDFTGVYYSGNDSVYLDSGKIRIPSFRIYDRDGNSGVFSGELRHKFLRDVNFDFRLREARNLLCYDMVKGPDDFWWGTVYGSGNAMLHGVPGLVEINVDMTSRPKSTFFFSLSDTEAAQEYNFLTFTDRTPITELPKKNTIPDFVQMFRKQKMLEESAPTKVHIDLRMNVTPDVAVTLVMDPVCGDKITATGSGPLQLQYETENDEPRIYGKYTIDEGLYNFSLQDVILRDFQIKEGSSISFNGDPLAAILDIKAAYRVNTSLTDLDKSFAMDRDLNRTNVPVDAMLLVRGPMDTPDIDFDIELPTLTEETARKVRSIISTNDQMSRQIIYLLALNKFYTPEYMDTSGSGGELASVASSTISSQLGNALSNLTDKLSVMPSFRSDKGDFSDLEMDVALSSRLLNNRLLINGNFGYRDRTTSTTTFVGDFDVQYLLNRRGTFRLKAYNHFNDQNYYLRQALTTQGIGIEFLHDFNRFLSFLRKKKPKHIPDSLLSPAPAVTGSEEVAGSKHNDYGSEDTDTE